MKNLVVIVSLLVLLMGPGSALAQAQDTMGLYFDLNGQSNCLDATTLAPFTIINLYLLLISPSSTELSGFEMGMDIEGPVITLSTIINHPQFIDVGMEGNHIVGFGEPMELGPVNHLITFEMMYTSTSQESVCFILRGSEPSSLDPLFPTVLYPIEQLVSTGIQVVYENCSALIDADFCNTVSTDVTTWDSLKSLYR